MIQQGESDLPVVPVKARVQFAALPYRSAKELQIMLISSRETRRWVLPKGWPIKGCKPSMVAAIEAQEEAGLIGKISKKPIGSYHYVKRISNGAGLVCQVGVFPLRVTKQRKDWPERKQRATKWFNLKKAAELVHEHELQILIREFKHVAGQFEENLATRPKPAKKKAKKSAI